MLAACTPHGGGAGGFAVTYPDATAARVRVGGHIYVKPSATCTRNDGTEARWAITGAQVTSGVLPPGVSIEDGTITGSPTAAGDFTATLSISGITCAGKPYPDQTASVHITAVAPKH